MKKIIYCTIFALLSIATSALGQEQSIFPLGEKAKNVNHTGDVWLSELNQTDSRVNSRFTLAVFAPNAKLNWHTHSAGQILLITQKL